MRRIGKKTRTKSNTQTSTHAFCGCGYSKIFKKDLIKNLKFSELEAASVPRVLQDVDAAVINGNYAIPVGLVATKDGLYVEGADSPYVNIVSVKEGNETSDKIKALVNALKSEKIKKYISETYQDGEVIAVF